MGTFLLGTFCALALVSAPKENPKDTVDVFVIDGKKMEHFDGNLLKNKFIFDYSMSCQDKGKHVERIHEINTNSRHYADSVRYRFELVAKQLREMNDSLKGQMIYYWNNSDCIDKGYEDMYALIVTSYNGKASVTLYFSVLQEVAGVTLDQEVIEF